MRTEVLTCKNSECQKFLFNSVALLDVVIAGKTFSIDPSGDSFEYANDDTVLSTETKNGSKHFVTEPSGVVCPHCQGKAEITNMDFDVNADKAQVLSQLDELDNLVLDLLAKCESGGV